MAVALAAAHSGCSGRPAGGQGDAGAAVTASGEDASARSAPPRDAAEPAARAPGDDDPCATDNGGCDPLVACTSELGVARCGACPEGYRDASGDRSECVCMMGFDKQPDGSCADVDECADGSHDCSSRAQCQNTEGGFTCGDCPAGSVDDGGGGCVDRDECQDDPCDPRTECTNAAPGFSCGACPPGFVGDGLLGCNDLLECATDNGGCDPHTECIERGGAPPECGACPAGLIGSGDTACVDALECLQDSGGCDPHAECIEQFGAPPVCGDCADGWEYDDQRACVDVLECAQDPPPCDVIAGCMELSPYYECGQCPAGFAGSPLTGCIPTLEWLRVSGGVLPMEPSFAPSVTEYTATSTFLQMNHVPDIANITIDAGAVAAPAGHSTPFHPARFSTSSCSSPTPRASSDEVITAAVGRGREQAVHLVGREREVERRGVAIRCFRRSVVPAATVHRPTDRIAVGPAPVGRRAASGARSPQRVVRQPRRPAAAAHHRLDQPGRRALRAPLNPHRPRVLHRGRRFVSATL